MAKVFILEVFSLSFVLVFEAVLLSVGRNSRLAQLELFYWLALGWLKEWVPVGRLRILLRIQELRELLELDSDFCERDIVMFYILDCQDGLR